MSRFSILTVSLLIFVVAAAAHADNQQKSFLWQVKSDSTTVYILGSIHVANKNIYPLNDVIETAFATSDKLVVEINENKVDPQKMSDIIRSQGMYGGTDSIVSHIDTKLFTALKAFLKSNNIPENDLLQYKPGMLAIKLSTIHALNLGFSPEYGIDKHFINRATNTKPILELETLEEQLSLLINIPHESLMLEFTLTNLSQMHEQFNKLIAAWTLGDINTIETISLTEPLEQYPKLAPIFDKLLFERNAKMAQKIQQYLKTDNIYFVVVGAGHLVGDGVGLAVFQAGARREAVGEAGSLDFP